FRTLAANQQCRIVRRRRNQRQDFTGFGFDGDNSTAFIDHQVFAILLQNQIYGQGDVLAAFGDGVVLSVFVGADIAVVFVFLDVFDAFDSAEFILITFLDALSSDQIPRDIIRVFPDNRIVYLSDEAKHIRAAFHLIIAQGTFLDFKPRKLPDFFLERSIFQLVELRQKYRT